MLNQAENLSGSEQLPAPAKQIPEPAKKPVLLNVDQVRDEFIENAQPVVDALRKRGKMAEAAQLEEAAKVIKVAVGPQPTQPPTLGDNLKGESVAAVLQPIWDVIEKDPTLRNMPQAQALRKATSALEGAGLLNITVRNGIVTSFVSNFADNFSRTQQSTTKPAQGKELVAATVADRQTSQVADLTPTPAVQANVASLLSPAVRAKAQALAEDNLATRSAAVSGSTVLTSTPSSEVPAKSFTKDDIPFELLAKMGVQATELEQNGQLQKLLEGKRTDLISSFSLRNQAGEPIPFAAKMVLQRDAEGVASLHFDLPKHKLEIPQQIMGKEITPAMKEQLHKTGVVLTDGLKDNQGQTFAAYIAIDKEMNKVVAVRQGGKSVPSVIHGASLRPEQQQQLYEGQPVRIEGMVARDGKGLFDATMQLDPLKRIIVSRDEKFYDAPKQTVSVQDEAPSQRRGVRL